MSAVLDGLVSGTSATMYAIFRAHIPAHDPRHLVSSGCDGASLPSAHASAIR